MSIEMDLVDWTMVSIVFYLGVLTMLSFHVFWQRRASVFEPVGLFLFFVSLFALPLPIRLCLTTEIEGNVSPQLMHFAPWLPAALALTALAIIVFVAVYYSPWARRLGDWIPQLPDRGIDGSGLGAAALVGLSLVLIYVLTESVGGIIAFLLLGYKSSEETFGRGYLAVGFPWLVVAMLTLLDRYAANRDRLDLTLAMLLLVTDILVFLITGNRAMIMYLVLAVSVFVHFRIRRIGYGTMISLAIVGFLALNLMGALRGSDYESLGDFWQKTFESSNEKMSTSDKENFFYTLTIGEFVVPFETLPQMMRTVGITELPWMGWSFVRAPVYMIPSFVFPDRPLPIANWYMDRFYGGSGGLNEGRQYFFLSEGYLNFGIPGVFLVAIMWGLCWGALHRWMERGRHRFGTVLIYALLSAYMFRCIAGDVVTLLVGTTQQSLAAVVVVFGVARLLVGRRRATPAAVIGGRS
jgi:hypothetical protein